MNLVSVCGPRYCDLVQGSGFYQGLCHILRNEWIFLTRKTVTQNVSETQKCYLYFKLH